MRSYNYSALSTAQKCPQLYKYKFIEKLPEPGAESLDLHFGTAMHVGVESILTSGGDGIFEFEAYWNSLKDKDLRKSRFGYTELADQGVKLLTRFKRLYAKKFVVKEMEQTLYGDLDGIPVYGTPDFYGDFEGIPSLVDFKTAKSKYVRNKILASEQLHLYTHLIRQARGFEVKQLVYFQFVKGTEPAISILRYTVNQDLLQETLSNLSRQLNHWSLLKDGDTFIKNKSACVMGDVACAFFEKCYPYP